LRALALDGIPVCVKPAVVFVLRGFPLLKRAKLGVGKRCQEIYGGFGAGRERSAKGPQRREEKRDKRL
jgi:hypothetical protein